MTPHFAVTLLMAALLAGASALLGRNTLRDRVYLAVNVFATSVICVVGGAWLMYWIHG